MHERIKSLTSEIQTLANELVSETYGIEAPPKEIGPALIELAAAEDEVDAHFKKWGSVDYKSSPERQAEWRPLCERVSRAQRAVLTFARAYVAKRRAAEMEPVS